MDGLNNEKCVPRITSSHRWSAGVCAGVQQPHGLPSCFPFLISPYINEVAKQVQAPPGLQAYAFPSKMTLRGYLPETPPQNAQLLMARVDHMLFP